MMADNRPFTVVVVSAAAYIQNDCLSLLPLALLLLLNSFYGLPNRALTLLLKAGVNVAVVLSLCLLDESLKLVL